MIYFLTERTHQVDHTPCTREDILNYCSSFEILALDTEFNSLDQYAATLLLLVIGDKENQYVIDCTSVDISFLEPLKDKQYIGHNIKIDYQICKINGFHFENLIDTLVIEQRLNLGSGRYNNLAVTLERRLGIELEKEVRSEFIEMTSNSIFESRHVEYAAKDIIHLEALYEKQKLYIYKYSMEFLIFDIELPLVRIIGDCELEGFVMDEELWKENIIDNKILFNKVELDLDSELGVLCMLNAPELLSGKYGRERRKEEVVQLDMFGEPVVVTNKNLGNINWSSGHQVKKLFEEFQVEIPYDKGKQTLNANVLAKFLSENRDHLLYTLLGVYSKYQKVKKELSTYGTAFLEQINSVTGRMHTVFRQCGTDTGRFASGDSKNGKPNMQNIPAHKKFRHCFGVEEGYEVTTCDLSGAELIIMCSLSGDKRLLELASGDMHSHMANLCWERIYEDRGLPYTDDLVVSKKQHKDKRTGFKPMTFGAIYGMRAKKAAAQLGVSEAEGDIVITSIKEEVPDVFTMVERAGKAALRDGYVVHNDRTNSRRWFMPVMDAKRELAKQVRENPDGLVPFLPFDLPYKRAKPEHLMQFMDKVKCESAARNCRIQGSQADMLKEALVVVDKHIKQFNWDLTLLGSVHDENIYKHPKGYTVVCPYTNKEVPIGDYIAKAMTETSNLYLNEVEMDAEYESRPTWTK